jgi:hypothetical protein
MSILQGDIRVTDDIAARLRIIHCIKDQMVYCGICLPCQAADEIERLRNDVKVRDLQILANFKAMDAMHKELYNDAD